jgi:hypothetical protein
MPGNVIQFPGKSERDWEAIETAFLDLLLDAGVRISGTPADRLKPLFDILSSGIDFTVPDPITPDRVNDSLSAALKEFTKQILVERMYREAHIASLLDAT